MIKQIVKNYRPCDNGYTVDAMGRITPCKKDIITQINEDLEQHPYWSICLLTYSDNGDLCTVVYNVEYAQVHTPNPSITDSLPFPKTIKPYKPECEQCGFYQEHIREGKMYVGDTPCTRCQHYPFRVTWENTAAGSSTIGK